jgi:D-aminoacyl-tRNA deacylase
MRVVIQRVSEASVTIGHHIKSKIAHGMLILVGFEEEDQLEDIEWMCRKISSLRIFNDRNGKMNLSVEEIQGEILIVSQFTLHANTKKGNRPSFIKAAQPEKAIPLYENFITLLEIAHNEKVFSGEFGADMKITLINDGPVTICIDSKNRE